MPEVVSHPRNIQPGAIFEDCRFHRRVNALVTPPLTVITGGTVFMPRTPTASYAFCM